MSAFIVEDKTINRIVTFILEDEDSSYYLRHLKDNGFRPPVMPKELGKAMFDLNVDSVEQRYGQGQAKEFRPLNYKYKRQIDTKIQVYKSLGCFLYQSCEGDCEHRLFYQALEKIQDELANSIVHALPEYDKAQWG